MSGRNFCARWAQKQLVETLADFWHNHFNVYFWQDDGVPMLASYNRDVLRAHMLGNFRQMLEAVATHPSMLYYLNQNNSSDAGPNENFARELFESRSARRIGLGCKTRTPLRKMRTESPSATWTTDAWRICAHSRAGVWTMTSTNTKTASKRCRFILLPWHDRFLNKLILGKYIPADQEDMKDGRDVDRSRIILAPRDSFRANSPAASSRTIRLIRSWKPPRPFLWRT
ncbi:MAG: DUF1800 family protein [Anaerolineales bacterium]